MKVTRIPFEFGLLPQVKTGHFTLVDVPKPLLYCDKCTGDMIILGMTFICPNCGHDVPIIENAFGPVGGR